MSEKVAELQALPSTLNSETAARPAATQARTNPTTDPKEEKASNAPPEDPAALKTKVEQAVSSAAIQQVTFRYETTEDGNIIIKIKDAETDKVIKQIPPEGQVEFARKLRDFLGILFDKQA